MQRNILITGVEPPVTLGDTALKDSQCLVILTNEMKVRSPSTKDKNFKIDLTLRLDPEGTPEDGKPYNEMNVNWLCDPQGSFTGGRIKGKLKRVWAVLEFEPDTLTPVLEG